MASQIHDIRFDWEKIKAEFPNVAAAIYQEYQTRNGLLPYEPGFVYAIHAVGTSYIKIGKTLYPDKRILQIAPQMPFRTQYLRVWRSNFMSMAEKHLHETYASQRVNGEWFDFQGKDEFYDPVGAKLFFLFDYFGIDNEIRYAYCVHFERLIKSTLADDKERWRFSHSIIRSGAECLGSQALSSIEELFSVIEKEFNPPLPEEIQKQMDCYQSYF
jgi:hypothetical protein